MFCIALHNVVPATPSVRLELSRVDKLANVVLGSHLFEDLFAVVGPESLGSVLAAVLEQDLLSSRVLLQCQGSSAKRVFGGESAYSQLDQSTDARRCKREGARNLRPQGTQ